MASVLDLVKHYQQSIEKHSNDEERVLRCIDKLYQLKVTTQHLQETGVGRTVNALRKEPGDVGKAARSLVYKWKMMVAAEESDQEGDQKNDTARYNGNGSGKESDDNTQLSKSNQDQHRDNSSNSKSSYKEYHKEVNGHHSGNKRKYHSSEEEEPDLKKGRNSSSSEDDKRKVVVKQEKLSDSESNDESDSSDSDSYSDSSESSHEKVKIKTEIKQEVKKEIKTESPERHESKHTHRDHRDSSSSKRSYESDRQSHQSSKSKESSRNSTETSKSSSHKHKSSEEKERHESSSDKKYKSDHTLHDKKEHKSNKHSHSEKRSSSEKHSSSSQKQDSSDKYKQSSERHSSKSTEKHKSSEKDNDKQKMSERESSKHRTKERSSSKDKNSSSSKDKSKDRSSSSKEKSSHSSEKKHSSDSKSHEKTKDSNERSSEKKHKEKSSSSSHRSKSSSSSKEDVPKKKSKKNHVLEDGIDCGSGASFAEALGMISPVKAKKKSFKDMSPSENDLSPAALLAPTAKLAPLPAFEISALPEISPNYKPRPPPKLLPHFNEEEAISAGISSKNQRTKVYSGNKVLGKIPSLYEMCVNILQEHIDALEYTGGVPYEILKPVVDRATPQQLFILEHYNPYLMEDTDHLWQKFCEKHFRNKKRQEMETWREMYIRCQEEQEHKLKSLTANIKLTQEAKKAPIKQTKMAYVDSVVKPPRNIARKQALHGTAHAASASPAARVASLASTSNVLKGGPRPALAPPVSSAAFNKPKKAPLMQKALQLMRGRKR